MADASRFKHVQVFCPECQRMISPGEYAMCPYFEGGELDLEDAEAVFRQLFNCHVKCGTKIEYHYYKEGSRVTTTIEPVENEAILKKILEKVMKHE